jgi:hypothetical protein
MVCLCGCGFACGCGGQRRSSPFRTMGTLFLAFAHAHGTNVELLILLIRVSRPDVCECTHDNHRSASDSDEGNGWRSLWNTRVLEHEDNIRHAIEGLVDGIIPGNRITASIEDHIWDDPYQVRHLASQCILSGVIVQYD